MKDLINKFIIKDIRIIIDDDFEIKEYTKKDTMKTIYQQRYRAKKKLKK